MMKKPALSLVLALLPLLAWGQLHRYDTGFNLSGTNFCDTIPLEVADNQLLLTVYIGGRPVKALLDTGSSQGVVFANRLPATLADLGAVVSRDANGQTDTIRAAQMPVFRLGNIGIEGYVVSIHGADRLNRKYQFVIGFDLFNKGLSGKIDTRNRRLILTDRRKHFEGEAGQRLKYKLKWFVPYLIVSPFIRHADEVLFDTGFRGLYTMNKQSFDKHAYKSKNVGSQVEAVVEGQSQIGLHGAEQLAEVAFLHLDRLQVGNFELQDVRAKTTSGSSKIGAELLQYGSVVLLPHRRTILFQPYGGGESVRVGNTVQQMAFVPKGDAVCVGLVNPMSDAYRAGFRQGDVVLEIDGRPIASFTQFLVFPFVKGQQHTFKLLGTDGQTRTVQSVR